MCPSVNKPRGEQVSKSTSHFWSVTFKQTSRVLSRAGSNSLEPPINKKQLQEKKRMTGKKLDSGAQQDGWATSHSDTVVLPAGDVASWIHHSLQMFPNIHDLADSPLTEQAETANTQRNRTSKTICLNIWIMADRLQETVWCWQHNAATPLTKVSPAAASAFNPRCRGNDGWLCWFGDRHQRQWQLFKIKSHTQRI